MRAYWIEDFILIAITAGIMAIFMKSSQIGQKTYVYRYLSKMCLKFSRLLKYTYMKNSRILESLDLFFRFLIFDLLHI